MHDHADDWELLEQFRLSRDQQAFAELVRRHAGFVLATCRRRLRDAHLSEDAAQAVFLVLARRPPVRSSANAALAGWLHKAAIYACNNAARARRSRDLHERRAAAELAQSAGHAMNHHAPSAHRTLDPAEVGSLLDDALANLSAKERSAVLLRYYQDQSVQQVGTALGISPNSATKRIGRAIERMREFLAGKGLAISPPAMVEAFRHATRVPPPPPDFVAQAIAVATGQSVASVLVQHLAEGVSHMIRVAKVKLVAAVVAVVLTAGGGVVAVNQLMAQSNAPQATAVTSNKPAAGLSSASAPEQRAGAATPKAALHALAAAGRAADVEGMKKLVDIKNPSEEQLLAAASEYAGARKAFLDTVEAKFGEPAKTRLGGMMRINKFDVFLKDLETKTDTVTEQIRGNQAVLSMEGETGNVWLVRDDGGWKLSATNMTKDWPQEKYNEVLAGVQQGNATLGRLTNEVNEGKFATFADLAKTVRGLMGGH